MDVVYPNFFGVAGQSIDPKELKRQKDRERYARNKDEINWKKREAHQQKKEIAANLNVQPTISNTPIAKLPGMFIIFCMFIIDVQHLSVIHFKHFMSGSHTPENATGQSAVTQLHHTPTRHATATEGDVYVMIE